MHETVVAMKPSLDVLGGFGLAVRARSVSVSPSAQRLLAFLAVSRKPVRRSLLAQRLWAGVDEHHAASSLRSTLWRMPRPHGRPLVTATADRVSLATHVHVDLWASEQNARVLTTAPQGRAPDALADGMPHEQLSADLLPDWSDDWLIVEQESYRQLRVHALERLSQILCDQGRYSAALLAALEAVRGDPLRESAHRHVISVHLAEGNSAEALREFHNYRRLLAQELGLPPSPAIRELVGPLLGRPMERPATGRRSSLANRPSAGDTENGQEP